MECIFFFFFFFFSFFSFCFIRFLLSFLEKAFSHSLRPGLTPCETDEMPLESMKK